MKNAFGSALLVLTLTVSSAAQTATAKPLNIAPEQVRRVEILYMDERDLMLGGLSPERLEELYQYKIEIRGVRESGLWQRLPSLLRETTVTPLRHHYDHRTAVLLFDKDGRRIASIYFDRFGADGTINGEPGRISGGFYGWAKALLDGITG